MMQIAILVTIVATAYAGAPAAISTYTASIPQIRRIATIAAPQPALLAAPQQLIAHHQPLLQQRLIAAPQPQLLHQQLIPQPQLLHQQQIIAAPQPALLAAPQLLAQPIAKTIAAPLAVKTVIQEPIDPHPQYSYGYSIQDGLTGDQKSHQESRDGDAVQGQYSLVEPDGSIRTVTYSADAIHGFNAVVDRTAPQVAVKTIAPAPLAIAKTIAAPISYAAPIATYAAPAIAKTISAAPAIATYAAPAIAKTIATGPAIYAASTHYSSPRYAYAY